MTNKARSTKRTPSLCEKSIELMLHFIKLSSLSLASITINTKTPCSLIAANESQNRVYVKSKVESMNVSKAPHPRRRRSQEPAESDLNWSSHSTDVDGRAANYIKKIREKNLIDSTSTASIK